jgi:hypothetical protein
MKTDQVILQILLTLSALLVLQPHAYAYIDPGTGSMAFQALLALLVGGLAAVKVYWHRIKRHLPGGHDKKDTDSPNAS